ncbi:MAG: S8/S53 family peptidase [Bacteroidota bacterium]
MKYTLITSLALLFSICTAFAQGDWTTRSNELYYYNGTERVFLQASTTAAIYFESAPNLNRLSRLFDDFPNATFSEEKLMMVLESEELFTNLQSARGRRNFLRSYRLDREGAFEVLPGFLVDGGYPAWFTTTVTVNFAKGTSISQIESILKQFDASNLENVKYNVYKFDVPAIEDQLPLIQELFEDGLITWGQPDFRVSIEHTNDPLYSAQYQMNNTGAVIDGVATIADIDIDAPEAWAITTGAAGLRVAVIDDGIEDHEDLPNITGGFTPLNNGNGTPNASGNHGEACAGIIAATHNNSIGVRGVAPNVQLQGINIFAGNESVNDLADAFYWAINNGSDVLSNSWGFTTNGGAGSLCQDNPYPALTTAINDAAATGRGGKGCVVIFAAGNQNSCVSYPGRLANVIAVGAIGPRGQRSYYSNTGAELDVVAPSSDETFGVRTTDREGGPGYNPGNYADDFGGTSAACPAVAGVGALILAIDPNLTGAQVHSILTSTADDMGSSGFDNTFGHGRVNAYEAVIAAQGNSGGGNGCNDNALTLTIVTDQYPQETSWNITDDNGNTVASGGGYTSQFTSYTEDICLPDGCYTFTILDSYGDGICCAYGNGSYTLTDGSSTLSSGGSFQSSEATDFSLNTNCGGGNNGGGCNYVTVDSENFDSGWGIWNDGGVDCFRLNNTTYSNSGNYSIRLRDNSGSASAMTTDVLNLSAYNRVKIDFTYITNSMDNANEDFFLEVSTNGGSSYQLLEEWNLGDEFQNNQREFDSVIITGGFTSNTSIRFRCDASANGDQVYIDDVVISACNDSGNIVDDEEDDLPGIDFADNSNYTSSSLKINNLELYPNPTSTRLNVDLTLKDVNSSATEVVIIDITGKTVLTKQLGTDEYSKFSIDVTEFAEGMYYLLILNEETRLSKTFVVTK